jgi:hypothetical protein
MNRKKKFDWFPKCEEFCKMSDSQPKIPYKMLNFNKNPLFMIRFISFCY